MMDVSKYNFCSEFYAIEKSIEVVVKIGAEHQAIRIEALHSLTTGHYCIRSYINVPPTYPQTSETFDRKAGEMRTWIDYDLPWTHCNSADEALNQALSSLKERCSSR